MPNRIPAFQISNFLSTHTLPLRLADLPSASPVDRRCPICQNPYVNPPTTYVHPDIGADLAEYAVQIHNRGPCAHIFGRRCIEAHVRGGNPWSHTCPMCRENWFPAPNGGRRQVLDHVEMARRTLAGVDVMDQGVRRELEEVDRALGRARDLLYGLRWI